MTTKPGAIQAGLLLLLSLCVGSTAYGQQSSASSKKSSTVTYESPKVKRKLDRSGEVRHGKASYYHQKFAGRKMADGTPMDPDSNIAASKTLPLGTVARVTNLENGKSEIVEIRDRGPYVAGRIVDLTPKTAKKLDIHEQGIASVRVEPIEVPQADGSTLRAEESTMEIASGE